jgi:hypothetical protein
LRPMSPMMPSRFPVQLVNTSNVDGDPIASADRVAFGSIEGSLPPSVYHRTIAVPELQTGRAALYARLRAWTSAYQMYARSSPSVDMSAQRCYSIELLGFGDVADSAYLPATSRAMDITIDTGNLGDVLLPDQSGTVEVVIRGSDALPIASIDRSQLVLVGPMAIALTPRSVTEADVAGAAGRNRPDGRADLVLEFDAAEVASTIGSLEDARSADVVSGRRRVPLALFARTLDGEELRTDTSMLFAGSAAARLAHDASARLVGNSGLKAGPGLQLSTRNLDGRVDATLEGAPGQDVQFSVYDARGRRMAEQRCRSAMDGRVYYAWNTGAVSPGIYFLRAQSDTGVANAKLVVIR